MNEQSCFSKAVNSPTHPWTYWFLKIFQVLGSQVLYVDYSQEITLNLCVKTCRIFFLLTLYCSGVFFFFFFKVHIHRGFLKTILAELEMLESPSSMKGSFTVIEKTRNDFVTLVSSPSESFFNLHLPFPYTSTLPFNIPSWGSRNSCAQSVF